MPRRKEPNYKMPIVICKLKFNDPDLSFDDWECDRPIKRCIWCPIPDRYEVPETPFEETKLRKNE